jgi:hypothetical protein
MPGASVSVAQHGRHLVPQRAGRAGRLVVVNVVQPDADLADVLIAAPVREISARELRDRVNKRDVLDPYLFSLHA